MNFIDVKMHGTTIKIILWGVSHATENQVHICRFLIIDLIRKIINTTNYTVDCFNKYICMLSNLIQLHVSLEFTY